jgi:YceI-like domain
MGIAPGKYVFGPDNGATLTVRTTKGGAAGKAGHNLEMQVMRWNAVLELGDNSQASLTADSTSFKVVEGTGGVKPLDAEEKRAIPQTIDEEVLKGTPIEFKSTRVESDRGGNTVEVDGELDLLGSKHPISFRLHVGFNGRMSGSAHLKQTEWGMTPYTALFGTLKVDDDVEVEIRADTRSQSSA